MSTIMNINFITFLMLVCQMKDKGYVFVQVKEENGCYRVYLKRVRFENSLSVGPFSKLKAGIVASRLERALIANYFKYEHVREIVWKGK